MSLPQYQVYINNILISDVIAFNCNNGRSSKSEPYNGDTGNFTVRNPQNLPVAARIASTVQVFINTKLVCTGFITNISYFYGIKSAQDTALISLEGSLAFFGRGYLQNFSLVAGTDIGTTLQNVGLALTGNTRTIFVGAQDSSLVSSNTYTGDAQTLINQLVATCNGRLTQGSNLTFYGRYGIFNYATTYPNLFFTDVLPLTSGITYDQIQFGNLTDNFYNLITINPAGLTTQVVGATTGTRNLQVNTLDVSNAQANNLANYLFNIFTNNTQTPATITTRNSMANFLDPAQICELGIATRLPITFRGATYQTVIEGYSVSGTVSDVQYTFNVSGFNQNNALVLNDAVYGTLNNNKLGY